MSIETELDMSLGKADALSGSLVSHIGKLPEPTYTLSIKYKLFDQMLGTQQQTAVDPVKPSEMLLLSINTSVSVGTVKKVKNNEAELALRIPVVPFKGENIAIARNVNNHWRLIGYGELV